MPPFSPATTDRERDKFKEVAGETLVRVSVDNLSTSPVPITNVGSSTPTMAVVTAANKDTEYSYAFPDGTKRLLIRARQSAEMKFSFTSGQSGTTYISVPAGVAYSEDTLNLTGKSIYFQFNRNGVSLEVLSWA